MMATTAQLPSRLHHSAYVSRDLEATRKFYEDVIGLPLLATWCESDMLFGAERTYCHVFFGLADGGALAFFQFEKPEDAELFGPQMPPTPFHHLALKVDRATQDAIVKRLKDAGYDEPKSFVLEHGYCRSVYATDPNGMIVEFTLDHPDVEKINATRRQDAHAELKALARRRPPLEQHVPLADRQRRDDVGAALRVPAIVDVVRPVVRNATEPERRVHVWQERDHQAERW
jgi:catechol 2,3-dioxygenase-like lactoylglutathione lyase family enzyme